MIERLVSQEVIAAGTRADYWLGKNEERWFFGLLFEILVGSFLPVWK